MHLVKIIHFCIFWKVFQPVSSKLGGATESYSSVLPSQKKTKHNPITPKQSQILLKLYLNSLVCWPLSYWALPNIHTQCAFHFKDHMGYSKFKLIGNIGIHLVPPGDYRWGMCVCLTALNCIWLLLLLSLWVRLLWYTVIQLKKRLFCHLHYIFYTFLAVPAATGHVKENNTN